MDALIKQTADAYINAFEPYIEGKEETRALVEKFKAEIYVLAESCGDITEFMQRFQTEGYQDRYTNMFSAIYMQSGEVSGAASNGSVSDETEYVPVSERLTVKQFVEQYRPAYEEIKKAGNRKNAEAIYEELFAVADRTDDLQEMSLILEREHLLFKIASIDLAESGTVAFRSMDPNWDLTVKGREMLARAYEESRSDEELTYRTEITKRDSERIDFNEQFKYGAIFGGLFGATVWWNMALDEVRSGGPAADKCIGSLIRQRRKARELWDLIEKGMSLAWDDIATNPYTRILLQYPVQTDELFRTKMVLPPESVDAVRYIWEEELISDRTIEDILINPSPMTYYMQISKTKDLVMERYRKKAEELNSHLPYFEMKKNLSGGNS